MNKNIWSLGLLRNGKLYPNKAAAMAAYETATNDGVAKLARYAGEDGKIKTIVGFYADAAEMSETGDSQSSYTILDIAGLDGDIAELKAAVAAINGIIGAGIPGTTLTAAINDINAKIGEGFSAEFTVADAIAALEAELMDKLKVSLDTAETPTSGYLKTYILSQGTGSGKTEIGRIDIPKDLVVESGSLVHGTWSGDTFTEDPEGPDTAIKLVIANQAAPIYINTKDLVDFYTAGDGIEIDNDNNTIAIKYNQHSEEFLIVDADGIRVEGIQAAIDKAVEDAKLEAGDGISIIGKTVNAVAAKFSAPGIENPIKVDASGIKFAKSLDCGFYDDVVTEANTAADVEAIVNPSETDVFVGTDAAFSALAGKTFKSIEAEEIEVASETSLAANESIVIDNVDVTGDKGSSNAFVLLNTPAVEVSNITVVDGAKPYNVFEQAGSGKKLGSFEANNVSVDDVALKHNVFNIYNLEDGAVINISNGDFNLDVNNSNVIRLANYANASNVIVNFENINWTYENTPNAESADWSWAGIVIYQPAYGDVALNGDLSKLQTWTFNFKNCKYNGTKVTANNFGEKNQVFYLYNINKTGAVTDTVTAGLTVNFE
jgi:hypothetical protein